MRKRIKPVFVVVFFLFFVLFILFTRSDEQLPTSETTLPSTIDYHIDDVLKMKPIIDVSGWQLPSSIDYDTLCQEISGAIVRVQSGSHTKTDNNASDSNGIDKSYKTHIEEFQSRGIPVAVYAYVAGSSVESMKKEAQSFYEEASPYHPTFYWLDVEEKTMDDMNAGVEAFRQELVDLGAKNVGIYVGTYFMETHNISTENFDAVWIPTYGVDSGYYDTAPDTDLDYDLHQYTSQGTLKGFSGSLDLNLITSLKEDPNEVYQKLFTIPQ